MKQRYERHDFNIYVEREVIGAGFTEDRNLSGGWIRTSSHLYFQEALDEKDRDNKKGLDVILVDTSLDGFPRRTYYSADGSRREHPKTRAQCKPATPEEIESTVAEIRHVLR